MVRDLEIKPYVFLSYCHDNFREAARLRNDLIDAGIDVWWDRDIVPGADWKYEIYKAMQRSHKVLLCLSRQTEARHQSGIYPEALAAVEAFRECRLGSIYLIPVRFSKCEIPPFEIDATRRLDRLQYIDLFPSSQRAAALEHLVNAIKETNKQNHSLSNIPKKKVLLIDDEADLWIDRFNYYLAEYQLIFIKEFDASQALKRIKKEKPDVVLLDIMFPDKHNPNRFEKIGGAILKEIKGSYPDLPVVMITTTLADAKYGVDEGEYWNAHFIFAKDRFNQPEADPYKELADQLLEAIKKAGDHRSLDERLGFIVGTTQKMQRIAEKILTIADSNSKIVLITGESGTGKELVAHSIHQLSARHAKPFVAVNCGGLTDEVLESQLFGHERGAFTGAARTHHGFFEQANGGTLFLDEVDAMSPALQDKLLRVLEDGRIRRMGAEKEISVDVRIISATNKNLLTEIAGGKFRQDLYFRLKVVELEIPPLRERLPDIAALYTYFVNTMNKKLGKNISTQPRPDVLEMLIKYSWPGNIRELQNVLESAMVTARSNVLTPSVFHLDTEVPLQLLHPQETDIIDQIITGKTDWQTLKDIQGAPRQKILQDLITHLTENYKRPPTSTELAKILKTSPVNMRRILTTANIRLRQYLK